jgi:membrane protease subunit HflC
MKNISIALGVLVFLFILSTVFTVDETEQVVILQFGKPVKTIKKPGFKF